MAEARAATDGVIATVSSENVNLYTDAYGLHLQWRVSIPRPKVFGRQLFEASKAGLRSLYKMYFPTGFIMSALFAATLVVVLLTCEEESWWRTGWIAEVAWNTAELFPWVECPLKLKIAILAMHTGFVLAFLCNQLQRLALRLLLSWTGWLYLPHGKVTATAKVWGFLVKLLGGQYAPKWLRAQPLLYMYKKVLPALPLPKLHTTVNKYLASIEPLHTAEEFAEKKREAEEFLQNEGPTLQRYLTGWWMLSTNYISPWWEAYVYLRGRSSLQINSNYYCLDNVDCPSSVQEARAAVLLWELLRYKEDQDDELIPPMLVRGTVPLCMEQHVRAFSTVRIPGRETDRLQHYEPEESQHVVVLCKGSYYKLDVVTRPILGRLLTPLELQAALAAIKDDAEEVAEIRRRQGAPTKANPAANVAALTALERTHWATVRERYFLHGINKTTLAAVESAICLVVLEDEAPKTISERSHSLLAGSGANRWFDKSLTMVAFPDGRCGINAEHSWADALVVAHIWERCICSRYSRNRTGFDADGNCTAMPADRPQPRAPRRPQRLDWEVNSIKLIEEINAAVKTAKAASDALELQIATYSKYGKGQIKKMRISPDSCVQMAMQLAFFRDQNKFGLTYEASMVRMFRAGRTETIRSLSQTSVAFVRAMEDAGATAAEKAQLLEVAAAEHSTCSKDAMTGHGVDRHLFGLYVVAQGKGTDSEFLKGALSMPWELSTSQQPQVQQPQLWNPSKDPEDKKHICPGGGFGPVADKGYGVSYMIAGENDIFFHVSCKKSAGNTSAVRFTAAIEQALTDIIDVYKVVWGAAGKK